MLLFSNKFHIFYIMLLTILAEKLKADLDPNLVTSFFKTKFLKFGYVFDCLSNTERINLIKHLMNNELRISENNINHHSPRLIKILERFDHHFGVIVDGDCINVENFLKEYGQLKLFDDRHHWFIQASNDSILNKLNNVILNINSDVYVAIPTQNSSVAMQNWTIFDAYNPATQHGGKLNVTDLGFYDKLQGFYVQTRDNKYWSRKNMTGVTFKTMVVLRKPFEGPLLEYLDSDDNRKVDSFNRLQYLLMRLCSEYYNYSVKINVTDNWGYLVTKTKFDGMVGAIQRKEIDFGSAAIYAKPERLRTVELGRGIWLFRSVFIFRHPNTRTFDQIFLHPMTSSVWYSMLIAIVLVLIVLKFTQKAEVKALKSLKESADQRWSTLVLFTLGIFCQQGSTQSAVLLCGRIVTISLLLLCLLFYQFYSGSIVSILLTKAPVTIKDLRNLIDSVLKVGSEPVPYIEDYFRTTSDKTVLELYHKKFLRGNISNYYPAEYGMELVQKGGFAFQVETSAAYTIIEETFSNHEICELREVKMFPITILMVPSQKHSPFRDMLNYCFQRLIEHGIGERQKKHWSPLNPECLPSSSSMTFHVNAKDIYPAAILLGVGILVSLLVLGMEMLVMKVQQKQPKIKKVADHFHHFVN